MADEKKVTVSDACISCGSCLTVNDEEKGLELFSLESGISEFVYKGEITEEIEKLVEKAAGECPVNAIEIE
ncbi:MAG: ferredoxin [Patescibacteria group bacterium]|jgi:ferredoxin